MDHSEQLDPAKVGAMLLAGIVCLGATGLRATAAEPAADQAADSSNAPEETAEQRLRFNFRYQPWSEVLDWFAEEADLSLVMDAPPPGTLNYTDSRSYLPAEAIDLLNSVLLTKGYTLVRRDRMLMVINLEDGIPPNLVPHVPLEELADRGEFELISVLFPLEKMTPDDAEQEVSTLLGPQGSIVKLPKAKQIMVTETAGRLRTIRSVIEAIEHPESTLAETPQLEVYGITSADPTAALEVLQTLLEGRPNVRLAIDPRTGSLIAHARPAEHATIRATLDQLQQEARQLEVIRLRRIDPQLAVLAINKLFSVGGGEGASPSAPKVDAEPTSRHLLVRGSESQIAQIRGLLEKMGESDSANGSSVAQGSNTVRMLPLTGRDARNVLDQLQQIWPVRYGNKIRIVTPSAVAPTLRSPGSQSSDLAAPDDGRLPRRQNLNRGRDPLSPVPAEVEQQRPGDLQTPAQPNSTESNEVGPADQTTLFPQHNGRFRLALDAGNAPTTQSAGDVDSSADAEEDELDTATNAGTQARPVGPAAEPPPIIVAPGPGGIMIASEDVEALDAFEQLLGELASGATTGGKEFTVFYLKSAPATVVAETLGHILGGGPARSSSGGGSPLGDIGGSAMGDAGGGIMGALMGMGGGGGAGGESGAIVARGILIVPDVRLNALVVQGNPNDLDTIEQLLEVLDQEGTPETLVAPRPRIIPILHSPAANVAEVVKQVYQDRLASNPNGQRQPSPEDFFRMLRGGGRGGRGGGGGNSNSDENAQKMSIGVDNRLNALVVSAPQPLFDEVEQLVITLDQVTEQSAQAVRVVTLKRANTQAVRNAVAALMGENVRTNGTSGRTGGAPSASSSQAPGSQPPQDQAEAFRQRMEFFQRMRGADMGGGGFGGFGGFGGRGGFGRGGFGPGAGGPGGGAGQNR